MRFCQFLKIMNCYIGQEKSQNDFMYMLFSMVVCEPFSEEEIRMDEEDEYFPFSKLCGESVAKKVYSGARVMPKALARFVRSHFDSESLMDRIDDMSDVVRENLVADFVAAGINCNIDNVSNVVTDTFKGFVDAALEETDSISTATKAESTISVQAGEASNYDVILLEEVSNICPLCGRQLLQSKKQKVIKKYKVIKIFPDNLSREEYLTFNKISPINGNYESSNNLITLCSDCALEYEAEGSVEVFIKLVEIKKTLVQKRNLQQSVENIDIEDDIGLVINGLISISLSDELQPLSMKALQVEQKISGRYGLLINQISNDVISYYKYIEEQFQIADSHKSNVFDRIASEVKLAYEKMEGNGIRQNQIYEELIEWMMRKLEFTDRYRRAVGIVISFFVQNCEVFHEIPK